MDFYYRKISPGFLKSLEESNSVHGLENIQNYLPIYTNFLNINNKNYNTVGLNSYFEPRSVVLPVPGHNANDADDDGSCDEYDPHYLDVEMVDTTKPNCNPEVKGVFVKYSPLLDPIRFLSGKYSSIEMSKLMELPTYADPEAPTPKRNPAIAKIMDVNNSAYVDGFFTYLSSKVMHAHKFVHGLDYYGAFAGHKRRFEVDITDDTDFFSNCSFFNSNLGKLFHMDEYSYNQMSVQNGSGMGKENASERAYKPKITIAGGKNVVDDALGSIPITFDTIDESGLGKLFSDSTHGVDVDVVNIVDDIENVYTKAPSDSSINNAHEKEDNDNDKRHSDSNSNSRRSSHDSRTSDTSCRDDVSDTHEECDKCDHEHENDGEHGGEAEVDGNEDDSEYDSEDEDEDDGIYVEIDKFPVNAILMEECEDTLDALMENDEVTSPEQWSSILMQIIMTLIAYQKLFGFTHNDLHTNNVMFIETQKEYLYYTYDGKHYRVPTFGKIFKIIDFGRAVYKFKNITMCSDSFHSSGDAATQYNFPPYMNAKKPLLEPNFSFDLCRLACSMFDYFIPMGDTEIDIDSDRVKQLISNNPIIALIDEWVRDDKGRNVLYKSSGKERYPDFKLYKMIARTVHNHVPAKQLSNPLFSKYEVKRSSLSGNAKQQFMNIDDWPEYYSTPS